MKKIKILIVADATAIASKISRQLTQLGFEVLEVITKGEDALRSIEFSCPDLVVVDSILNGQMNGIEISRQIRERFRIPVIFITADSDDSMLFNTARPYASISKPIRPEELQRAIQLSIERMAEEAHPATILPGGEGTEDTPYILRDRVFVRYKDKMVKIFFQDICFAKADRNYCKIYTSERAYLLSVPLGTLEGHLPEKKFTRVHRSFIVNFETVDAVEHTQKYLVIGKHEIPVSRRFKRTVRRHLLLI